MQQPDGVLRGRKKSQITYRFQTTFIVLELSDNP